MKFIPILQEIAKENYTEQPEQLEEGWFAKGIINIAKKVTIVTIKTFII